MKTKIELKIGKVYSIYEEESKHRDYSFDAFYIGKKAGEDIFASTHTREQIILYEKIKNKIGPEISGKFAVSKIETKPSKLEETYLKDKLNEWVNNKNVA